jgi:CBS domain-containing protein
MRTVAAAMMEAVLVSPQTTIQDASAAMLDGRSTAAVVVEGRRVRGLITAADVARTLADGREAARTLVRDAAQPDPPRVAAEEALAKVHLGIRERGQPLAVVIGDDGRPVGLLADPEAAP